MGFSLGGFASGLSSGIQSGMTVGNQIRQQQFNKKLAQIINGTYTPGEGKPAAIAGPGNGNPVDAGPQQPTNPLMGSPGLDAVPY